MYLPGHPAFDLLEEWTQHWKDDNTSAQSIPPEVLSELGKSNHSDSLPENSALPSWISHLNASLEKAREAGHKWVSIPRDYFSVDGDVCVLPVKPSPRIRRPEQYEMEFRLFGIDGGGVETAISGPAMIWIYEKRLNIGPREIAFIEAPKGTMLFYSVLYLEEGWNSWKLLECRTIPESEKDVMYSVRTKL